MKKIICGKYGNIYTHASSEPLDDYIEILSPYFKNICHHYSVSHNINKDVILIYSYFPQEVNCGKCAGKGEKINIPMDSDIITEMIGESFFDIRDRSRPCSRILTISYNNNLLGFYCKKNNMMLISDIAHSDGNEKHIKFILDSLKNRDIISEHIFSDTFKNITIGSDPELETVIKGEYVAATELMQLATHEKVYISHDGHTQPQRELRPDHTSSPEELVENIRDLIKISNFFGEDLSVRGKNCPLGGHIHFGDAYPSKELIYVLDYFLFPFNEFNSQSRKDSKYGKMGDFRIKYYGFEYRTPPSAWLLTPTLALMTLQLSKKIVELIINNKEVQISDNYNIDEYIENLKILFEDDWVNKFMKELDWAKNHLDEPLAKTWGVEIPTKYKIKKEYRYKKIEPTEGL